MRARLIFAVSAAFASSYAIQLFHRQTALPDCAITCISQADTSGCDPTDAACLCSDPTFMTNVGDCIMATCMGADLTNAEAAAATLCSGATDTATTDTGSVTTEATDTATDTAAATMPPVATTTPATVPAATATTHATTSATTHSTAAPAATSSHSSAILNQANVVAAVAAMMLAALGM